LDPYQFGGRGLALGDPETLVAGELRNADGGWRRGRGDEPAVRAKQADGVVQVRGIEVSLVERNTSARGGGEWNVASDLEH
jgi:hypothetical protein